MTGSSRYGGFVSMGLITAEVKVLCQLAKPTESWRMEDYPFFGHRKQRWNQSVFEWSLAKLAKLLVARYVSEVSFATLRPNFKKNKFSFLSPSWISLCTAASHPKQEESQLWKLKVSNWLSNSSKLIKTSRCYYYRVSCWKTRRMKTLDKLLVSVCTILGG